jgi:hypothetical protein
MELLEYHVGHGYCHAWYLRRFLESVRVSEVLMPHAGLGLDCYVQWSSPIRRFSDLQVHTAVKRYIRRRKFFEMVRNGAVIPKQVTATELGLPERVLDVQNRKLLVDTISAHHLDCDIDFMEGIGLIGAARILQRQSQQYWLFEYVRRQKVINPELVYNAIILGCVDPEKQQYAIYVKELGLEHRYTSPVTRLNIGAELKLKVGNVTPRSGLLSFVRVV